MLSSSSSSLQQRNFSLVFITISMIFWVWAILNTISNHRLDFGIVSFLSVLITHSILLSFCCCQSNNNDCGGGASYAVLCTHLFVTLNYLLGVNVALWTDIEFKPQREMGFAIYCGVAALLWFISSIIGYKTYKNNSNNNDTRSSSANEDGAPVETRGII